MHGNPVEHNQRRGSDSQSGEQHRGDLGLTFVGRDAMVRRACARDHCSSFDGSDARVASMTSEFISLVLLGLLLDDLRRAEGPFFAAAAESLRDNDCC